MVSVLLAEETVRRCRARIEALVPGVELVCPTSAGGWSGDLDRVEVALFSEGLWTADFERGPLSQIVHLPRLRWLHTSTSGTDHPLFGRLRERGIVVTTSAGAMAEPMAEFALALMLRICKRMDFWADLQRRQVWGPTDADICGDLAGKTLGIIGLGHIGKATARMAQCFGVRVLGSRRRAEPIDGVELVPAQRLDELFAASDFVLLSVPLTESTRHLVDAQRLASMRQSAWLINLSRGAVVDETALIAALETKRIAGACLDVFAVEPLPSNHPFWTLPNTIVTPHIAATSPRYVANVTEMFLSALPQFIATGEPPRLPRAW